MTSTSGDQLPAGWWLAVDGRWYPPQAEPGGGWAPAFPIRVQLRYDKGDYWRFLWQSFLAARAVNFTIVAGLILPQAVMISWMAASGRLPLSAGVSVVAMYLVAIAFFLLGGVAFDRRRQHTGPGEVVFSEDGCWSGSRNEMLEWKKVRHVRETADFYQLERMGLRVSTEFISKCSLSAEEDWRLRILLVNHVLVKAHGDSIWPTPADGAEERL